MEDGLSKTKNNNKNLIEEIKVLDILNILAVFHTFMLKIAIPN